MSSNFKEKISPLIALLLFIWTLSIARQIAAPSGVIGVQLDTNKDKTIFIKNIVPNMPAAESGLQINDIIIKVDNKSMDGKNQNYVISQITGKTNTNTKILIKRDNKEQEFDIKRVQRKMKWFILF